MSINIDYISLWTPTIMGNRLDSKKSCWHIVWNSVYSTLHYRSHKHNCRQVLLNRNFLDNLRLVVLYRWLSLMQIQNKNLKKWNQKITILVYHNKIESKKDCAVDGIVFRLKLCVRFSGTPNLSGDSEGFAIFSNT